MGDEAPMIGVSANVFHEDPDRDAYNGRPLLYLEASMADWLMRGGARPYMIPFSLEEREETVALEEIVAGLDGLVLHGGADIAPETYGEEPRRDDWEGDAVRDAYEIELVEACLEYDRPVLGICRGAQLLNVAFGGTLYQDIETEVEGSAPHRDREAFDGHEHEVSIEPDSVLSSMYGGATRGRIVSVHHQAIRDLADDLIVEARSVEDGLVEAVRHDGGRYVAGVQWHPEFQQPDDDRLLDPMVLLHHFLKAVRRREP